MISRTQRGRAYFTDSVDEHQSQLVVWTQPFLQEEIPCSISYYCTETVLQDGRYLYASVESSVHSQRAEEHGQAQIPGR